MFILYDLIFLIFVLASLPLYLLRGKLHRGFFSRMGFLPAGLDLERPIWVHAVSVGEVMAVRRMVEELRKSYPRKKFVISTVTAFGNKIAAGLAKDADLLTYLPFDFSFNVARVINRVAPQVFIIAETELWPNLILRLYKNKIPVVIVNARISDSSYRGYSLVKPLLKPILRKVTLFCAQSSCDALRLQKLGADGDSIRITGNLKFDLNMHPPQQEQRRQLRDKIGVLPQERLLVCGSTHAQEEDILLELYGQLRRDFPRLRLLLAPRHTQRSKDISALVRRRSISTVFISRLPQELPRDSGCPVLILDTIGELNNFYDAADIVFIGGSMVKKGGHNIIEPASFKKPVLFGPHMFNFRDIADLFLGEKAAVMAQDTPDLREKVRWFMENEAEAAQMGERAYELVRRNCGSSAKTVELIRGLIDKAKA